MKDKIIHLSETDISGGSSYYAYRIHKYFNSLKNVKSKMYVLEKHSNDDTVGTFNYTPNIKFFKKINFFFLNKKKTNILFTTFGKYVVNDSAQIQAILNEKPRAIILYNNSNFVHPKILEEFAKKKIKLFFYPMDMELITGGCHYNF